MSRKILIIDDDHDVVRGTSLRLRSAGYEIAAAYDGEEGVAAAKELTPDAIVLDVRMPRLDGLGALDRLRRCDDTKHIPVVMVSASLVDRHAALDSGALFPAEAVPREIIARGRGLGARCELNANIPKQRSAQQCRHSNAGFASDSSSRYSSCWPYRPSRFAARCFTWTCPARGSAVWRLPGSWTPYCRRSRTPKPGSAAFC